jgi:hypothetical protein
MRRTQLDAARAPSPSQHDPNVRGASPIVQRLLEPASTSAAASSSSSSPSPVAELWMERGAAARDSTGKERRRDFPSEAITTCVWHNERGFALGELVCQQVAVRAGGISSMQRRDERFRDDVTCEKENEWWRKTCATPPLPFSSAGKIQKIRMVAEGVRFGFHRNTFVRRERNHHVAHSLISIVRNVEMGSH